MSKTKKGITLIEIVIVIIILILLAIIAIYNTQKMSLKAEAVACETEFKALYTALSSLQTQDNMGLIDFDREGEGVYFNKRDTGDSVTWYVVFGKDETDEEKIYTNLGLDNLKRSYRFRLRDLDNTRDEIFIEYLYGSLKIGDYSVRSYEDIINLMNSGAI